MFVGIGMNLVRGGASSSPASLFANGEVGVWYDPSQINTLFQDNTGTTPVTGPNQTVGLMLDKSKNGIGTNGASCRNLLTYTEQFDNAVWVKTNANVTVTANTTTAPDGTLTADTGVISVGGTDSAIAQPFVVANNSLTYTTTLYVKRPASENSLRFDTRFSGGTSTLNYACVLNWSTLSISTVPGGNAPISTSITATGNGWYRVAAICANNTTGNTTAQLFIYPSSNFNGTVIQAGSAYLWGAQIELGSTATAYQPITSSWAATIAGNHATQAISTQRPIYGINPITGTRNLLTYTEQFDNAAWTKLGTTTVTADTAVAPDGTTTVDRVLMAVGGNQGLRQDVVLVAGTYRYSVWARAIGSATTLRLASFGLDGSKSTSTALPTGALVRYVVTFTFAVGGTAQLRIDTADLGGTIEIWGAQIELGSAATAYQKVVSQYEVTQAGVASASYLAHDGVDDGMVTGTITPNIDKAQVFAGVRKISTSTSVILETSIISSSNAGSFGLFGPDSANQYTALMRGTITALATTTLASFAAPITNVLTGIGDISGDVARLRINGSQVAETLTDQGTGNYLAYPLYIGRRGGVSLPFNGRLYSLIVRFGANLTTGQITSTESWVNSKTGAY